MGDEVSQIAAEDEEIAEYVRALEEREDEDEPLKPASGEAIAAEFERYLRRRGRARARAGASRGLPLDSSTAAAPGPCGCAEAQHVSPRALRLVSAGVRLGRRRRPDVGQFLVADRHTEVVLGAGRGELLLVGRLLAVRFFAGHVVPP